MAPDYHTSSSVAPPLKRGYASDHVSRRSDDNIPKVPDGRSYSNNSVSHGPRGSSLAHSAVSFTTAGSFSTDLRSTDNACGTVSKLELPILQQASFAADEGDALALQSEQRQALVRDQIAKEMKIKSGTENMLVALQSKNPKQSKEQRLRAEIELRASKQKLQELQYQLNQEIQRLNVPSTPPRHRTSSYPQGSPSKSALSSHDLSDDRPIFSNVSGESPSLVLTEILQQLEVEGMTPDYYIERANTLVELFKRHPTLKYDLAWPVFSLRVQMMLLSDSTDVVAAGYRLTRYAIADRSSLETIRALHTDELVILSLVKKHKTSLEREQAIKFVRAFMEIKDGVAEISAGVVRALVAVAEQQDDRLRGICVLTLAEILVKDPSVLIEGGGLNTLIDILAEGTFEASESIVVGLLRLLDTPHRRRYLKSGHEINAVLGPLTDPLYAKGQEERLRTSVKAVATILKTWPGLVTLSRNNAYSLRSLLGVLQYPTLQARDLILELLFDVLRIKAPSWSSSFLAGRRLTTYGRGASTRTDSEPAGRHKQYEFEPETQRLDLTTHFSTLVLSVFLAAGLVNALIELIKDESDLAVNRKATLLLAEVLRLSDHCLAKPMSADIQVLGDAMTPATIFNSEDHVANVALIFQIDSIDRTLNRISYPTGSSRGMDIHGALQGPQGPDRSHANTSMTAEQFRQAIVESHVANHTQYIKWNWDLIHRVVEDSLSDPKRLDEVANTKFLQRLTAFYRPFKYRFSTVRNTRPNRRYVRTGCALIKALMQSTAGIQYLMENKLLRQIAECMAQVDRLSGLTSTSPIFDRNHLSETLSGGYFAMIGILSQTSEGIVMLEKWHMINMFYHIVDLRDRDDLVEMLLGNMDYSIDSHLRVILSKALTAGSRNIRLFATKLLRRYATRHDVVIMVNDTLDARWVLNLLLTQLYDPDVEVCEVAVKNLEEACNRRSHLEYVVQCRPSLDHLGEIGAPLLLRFLSSSVGYHYLDGLDYITQEMDDWFLGRNDSYVSFVEASLARAYNEQIQQGSSFSSHGEGLDLDDMGVVPPHFYRELARTEEGCRLLEKSGHFAEFASVVRNCRLDEEDAETLTKVKGCLWAIGNVGSMELGAPFLAGTEIVCSIVAMAEEAQVISLRGTAFFVLGVISRSTYGHEMLLELGWQSAIDSCGRSLGLCLPEQLDKLCSVQFGAISSPETSKGLGERLQKYRAATTDEDAFNTRLLKAVVEMANSVVAKKVEMELRAIKTRHPEGFTHVSLFKKTLLLLESHHYRQWQRQAILDLFDKNMIRRIVLEEDEQDERSSNGVDGSSP